jgi:predicted RNA binding protein YcfA (HicA-like mRNA interferase family)
MNDIDYSKLRSLTAREIVNALIRDEFYIDRVSGSHHQFLHPAKGQSVLFEAGK